MRVYIIGFMGAGKTTFGRRLAKFMKFKFYDLDKLIEEKESLSVAEYFSFHGEKNFRKLEKEILNGHPFENNSIISCGGGTPCFFDNMQMMNKTGITVFINVSRDILFNRLIKAKSSRPSIKNFDSEELKIFIRNLLNKRMPFYVRAKIQITKPDVNFIKTMLENNEQS